MKILCLNSGGFDSVVLLYEVRYRNPDAEIHTLIFNYGQKSWPKEYECALKSSNKVGAKLEVINLPEFTWSKNYNNFENDNFIEYRNLVFLAYASSLAQAIGAEEIHIAWLDFEDQAHLDGSDHFYKYFKELIRPSGIELKALFLDNDLNKSEVYKVAKQRGFTVKLGDFNSCDYLDNDLNPCGKCPDCLVIQEIYNPID